MRRTLFILAALVAIVGAVVAARDVAFATLTISTSSVGLPAALHADAAGYPQHTACEGVLDGGAVRYRFDNTAPTAAVGTLLQPGQVVTLKGHDIIKAVRFIRQGSTDGVLSMHCWE